MSNPRSIRLNDLGRYVLRVPIVITLEDDAHDGAVDVLARETTTETYALGANEEDAIVEMKEQLANLYDSLELMRPDQLGTALQRWLVWLRERVEVTR